MKRKILICISSLLLFTLAINAQVKIGNNPGTIDANSILEMESTNKGLLAPRVALNDQNSASPLTAPVPSGMIVYSSGGTLSDGFYFWNGTKWLAVQSSANVRSNYVLVKSAADLPVPVNGVITLVAGTTYEVNGTIMLTSKINLNGCCVTGLNVNNDKLIYTPATGELFTGTKGGTIKTLTLAAITTGSKLFNFDMASTETLIVKDCIIGNCKDIGLVKGGYICFFTIINYAANLNGITFQDIGNLLLDNMAWFSTNSNTFEKFVGTFTMIEKLGGFCQTLAANSAIALDISGITTITEEGNLKNTAFLGTGTKLVGTFSKKWEVEASGLTTEKDAVATGSLYISSYALTTVDVINTPVKIAGTTTTSELVRFISPANNRLQYDGSKTRTFIVTASMSATGASGTNVFSFYIYKNGVQVPSSRQRTKVYSASGDITAIAINCTVTLAPGDYIEVWTENNDNHIDITVQNMTLTVK